MKRIDRRSVSPKLCPVSAAVGEVLGPNPRRVGIIFGSTPQGSVSYSWQNGVVIDKGTYNIPASAAYVESLCCCEYGTSLQGPLFAVASGTFSIEITEIISDDPLE